MLGRTAQVRPIAAEISCNRIGSRRLASRCGNQLFNRFARAIDSARSWAPSPRLARRSARRPIQMAYRPSRPNCSRATSGEIDCRRAISNGPAHARRRLAPRRIADRQLQRPADLARQAEKSSRHAANAFIAGSKLLSPPAQRRIVGFPNDRRRRNARRVHLPAAERQSRRGRSPSAMHA